ncbi:uncharacterized protein ASCRUDRAFT_80852 [Ascoidea rubescens DSM 1968]|uniref:Metacaspase-1 n=1 Tax=Ascoidea rubescens DSM 1968 TaxID=1344418 RepID=A0A1D2VHY7_9ASCO|nr:hypothetical protein ASCRUDRAFT_80852 [Ascoidea rubescens DSM 1968]ODV61093.1 hypothetical protein ASCRUDRAFT_80852 [Ascoidea rubescens DSM 1968]
MSGYPNYGNGYNPPPYPPSNAPPYPPQGAGYGSYGAPVGSPTGQLYPPPPPQSRGYPPSPQSRGYPPSPQSRGYPPSPQARSYPPPPQAYPSYSGQYPSHNAYSLPPQHQQRYQQPTSHSQPYPQYPPVNDPVFDFIEAKNPPRIPTREIAFSSRLSRDYKYKYSNCEGKRKALLIGINYYNTKFKLNGCINDVKNLQNFLLKHGYKKDDMVILTDDNDPSSRSFPSRRNIIDAMKWLVSDSKENDSLFFHFSGHGSQIEDQDGDELDGFDETICPYDFESNGQISDDELHEIMVRPLPEGCRLTALFDCCHSGSMLDLPYTYNTKGVLKEPNLMNELGQGLLPIFGSYAKGDKEKALKSVFKLVKNAVTITNNAGAIEKTKKTKTSPADVIMLSGCKDDQTSADAHIGGEATGAMSYAFIQVMNTGKKQSYLTLLQNTRKVLEAKYSQKPQLSASHPIDTNLEFIF